MRESKTIEFKREYTENLKYEVIAFAILMEERYISVLRMTAR